MHGESEFSQEEMEAYEEQLNDLDVKALLAEQNALLNAIYQELTEETQAEQEYLCTSCQTRVLERDLQSHAQSEHNAPDTNVMHLYEPV